jgi:hypothetical protein
MCNTKATTESNHDLPISPIKETTQSDYDLSPDSPVLQYYAGKTLFITGVTGFCGKVWRID